MKAIVVNETSPTRELTIQDVAEPVPGPEDVCIKVYAAGVNRADLLQRAGKYPPPPGTSPILGLEVSGEIIEVGSRVTTWRPGMKVCALLSGGGYAEKTVAHAGSVIPLPARASFVEGAAIPEAFITAFTNLFFEANLRTGESVLIHGGSSGVGTAAIQLARAVGARVAVTVGTEEKAARCEDLGADKAVVYRDADFVEEVRSWAGGFGVDVVLDCIGSDYLSGNLAVLGIGGRVVVIGTMSGARSEVDLATLMRKRARLIGSVLRPRTPLEKADLVRLFMERFWSFLEFRKIYPVIHETFLMHEVARAHDVMKASTHIGKLIITINTDNNEDELIS